MALDPVLLSVLACPQDKQPMYYFETEGWLYNPRLHLRYSIDGDIPILLPDAGEQVDDAEHERLMALVAQHHLLLTGQTA